MSSLLWWRKERAYPVDAPLISDHVTAAVMELFAERRDPILERAAEIARYRLASWEAGGDIWKVPDEG